MIRTTRPGTGSRRLLLTGFLLLLTACGDEAPAPDTSPPAEGLAGIALEMEEGPEAKRRAVTVAELPPADHVAGGDRAWLLAKLFREGMLHENTVIRIEGPGEAHEVRVADPALSGARPVFLRTADGKAFVAFLRTGESPALLDVRHPAERIVLRMPATREVAETPESSLELVVSGTERTVPLAEMAKIPTIETLSRHGGRQVRSWSLREVAKRLVGEDAIVTRVEGGNEQVEDIGEDEWTEPSRMPVLRVNRRGAFKFEWVDTDGRRAMDAGLTPVTRIVIETR